ncbi:SacI homology domain-containing protein [Gorgonomyces haynaldii]|nr:SacI homology domain-containing protein [Gorgonomyces haynaldii]
MTLKPIHKTSFRVFKINDGRTLIENPVRIDANGQEPSEMLVITASSISVQAKSACFPSSSSAVTNSLEVMGVLGILELSWGKYLLTITARTFAGSIQSHKIWRITGGMYVPLGNTQHPINVNQMDDESLARYETDQELLGNLKRIINSGHLYYSTSYDLTHSLQHNALKSVKTNATIIDDRYFFNQALSLPLLNSKSDCSPWISKSIAGFCGSIDMDCPIVGIDGVEKTRTYTVVLVSRLNHRRLGTRYVRRGLDEEGNAANNVEMEQIVFNHDFLKDKAISAFVQIRGSAPSIWGQELDLSYRPRLHLADMYKENVWSAIKKHYQDLKHQYIGEKSISGSDLGQVVCVNLLDDTGFEKPLTDLYEKTVKRFNDPKIIYESFPVSKWCKKMNYKNMEILVDRVRLPLVNSGWLIAEGEVPSFYSSGSLRCSRLQTGTARVSCLDSLDRTNLTCSWFAKYVLPYQVQSISPDLPSVQVLPVTGVSPTEVRDPASQTRKALEPGLPVFTNLWADSGDAISVLYAGTKALKADVTRTGKRLMIKGSVDDGINALTRYYLNNFMDGEKQDAYDLWTGKTTADKVKELAVSYGLNKALHVRQPIIPTNSGVGRLIPSFVVETVKPALEAAQDFTRQPKDSKKGHLDENGNANTVAGFAVVLLKSYTPHQVSSPIQFIIAMFIFFYILILSKLFKIKGQQVVSKPKLTTEYAKLVEIDQ